MQVYDQLEVAQAENLSADSTRSLLGQIWYNTTTDRMRFYDGALRAVVTDDGTETLTNKTITGNIMASFSPDGVETVTSPVASGTLVLEALAQNMSNKTITASKVGGGAASTTNKLLVSSDTKANLDALVREEKSLYYDEDSSSLFLDNGTDLVPVGSGGGGNDVFFTERFEVNNASDLRSGNNATFLGGGLLVGVLADETASPISGLRSISYTNAIGAENDYVAVEQITLADKQKGQTLGSIQYFDYAGDKGDIQLIIYDETNSKELARVDIDPNINRYNINYLTQPSTAIITFGIQVIVANNGAILLWDEIEGSSNSQIENSRDLIQYELLSGANGYGSTDNKVRRLDTTVRSFGSANGLFEVVTTAANGTVVNVLQDCEILIERSDYGSTIRDGGLSLNASSLTTNIQSIAQSERISIATTGGASQWDSFGTKLNAVAGDVIRPHDTGAFTATIDAIMAIHAVKHDAVTGVISQAQIPENKYSGVFDGTAAGSVSTVSENIAGTFTVSRNSLGNFNVNYSSLGLNVIPAITVTPNSTAAGTDITTTVNNRTATDFDVVFEDISGVNFTDADFSVIISLHGVDHKSLTTNLVEVSQPILYVKDLKAANTDGGTFSGGGVFNTRDLNTLEGDTSFASLSANQLTLAAGKYDISGWGMEYASSGTKGTKIRLRNITDATTAIVGGQGNTGGNLSSDKDMLGGIVEIASSKTFELQHACTTTTATNGFGVSTNFGEQELYAQLKIKKIK